MWNPLKAYWDYKLRRAQIEADARNKPFETMAEVARVQSETLKEWLAGFKSTSVPTTTTQRDEDDFAREEERERQSRMESEERSWDRIDPASIFPALGGLLNDKK